MNTFLEQIPIAHRGLHGKDPENSMRAFEAAIGHGYAIETDVRLSKDGQLVLFHDDGLARMTGVKRAVSDCTVSELKELRLDGKEKIPLFSEFLEELAGRAPLLLEIKNVPQAPTDEFIGKVAKALQGYAGEYAVQSFQPFYVKAFKKARPDILCGVLGTADSSKSDFGGSPFWRFKARVLANMSFNRLVKPDFISYRLEDLPRKQTEAFRGIRLAWVARSEQDEERARKYADNIIFENYLPTL